jgi:hypothetical protein
VIEEEEEEEKLEDDFRIGKTGPNFALRSFLAFLFLSDDDFEAIATDLDVLIPFLMNISKTSFASSCVDAKKVVDQIARKRLEGYFNTYEDDLKMECGDGWMKQAVMLRMEEQEILKSVIF